MHQQLMRWFIERGWLPPFFRGCFFLPSKTCQNVSKRECLNLLLYCWFIFKYILNKYGSSTSINLSFNILDYVGHIQRIEGLVCEYFHEENEKRKAFQSISVSVDDKNRMYLKGVGLVPPPCKYPGYAKFGHGYIDYPPYNDDISLANEEAFAEFFNQNEQLKNTRVVRWVARQDIHLVVSLRKFQLHH